MYFSRLLITDVINYGVSKGANEAELCTEMGLQSLKSVKKDEFTDYEEVEKVFSLVKESIQDDYIGLHMGEKFSLNTTDQVNQIMSKSQTLQDAFENAVTYGEMISDAFQCSMEETENCKEVVFEINPNFGTRSQFVVQQVLDLTMVCTMFSIHVLTGKKHFPTKVNFPFSRVKRINEYLRVFDCPLAFNKRHPSILFDSKPFEQELLTKDNGLLQKLKGLAEQVILGLNPEPDLILKVKKCVVNHLPAKVSLKEVALELQTSTRTLQRNLKRLNTTFKIVERDIILKTARKLVHEDNYKIDELSYFLGFSESSSFIRFFKSEMNVTPAKYRKLTSENHALR